MPSVGEIITFSMEAVDVGVDVASGVTGILEVFDVSEVSEVGVSSAGVEVGEEGVEMLWQAVRRIMESRNGMIFFIGYLFVGQACSLTFFEKWALAGCKPALLETLLNQLHCLFCLVFKKIGIYFIGLLPGFECAVVITFAVQPEAIPQPCFFRHFGDASGVICQHKQIIIAVGVEVGQERTELVAEHP